jgi:leucyl aminopeptidase
MRIIFQNKKLSEIKSDCEIILIINKNFKHKWVKDLEFLKQERFKAKKDEVLCANHEKRVYYAIDSINHENIRIATSNLFKTVENRFKTVKIGIYGGEKIKENFKALAEGFFLGSYKFDKYKSDSEKTLLNKIFISSEEYEGKKTDYNVLNKELKKAFNICEAVNLTRDIVNEIPAEITPVKMSEIARKIAKENNLKVKIYGENFLKKEKMGAFLAVSKASPYPPQLIHFIYKPENKAKKKIVLVGKGLTYDSGGLSIKTGNSMVTMKSDKSGASAIFGIMRAVSKLNFPYEVHGIVGATENMIGEHSYKPDDVLTARNKKTIEVRNTDAEGRLVLADCLCYAQDLKPDYIIDLATLTGACVVALGEHTIGVMGHNKEMVEEIIGAGEKSGEAAAYLPFNRYLPLLLKSEVADISNISSGNYGGAITAGLFLSEFILEKNKNKWVHLDIAGPAFVEKSWGFNSYGASGAGVKIIIEWIDNLK